MAVKKKKTIPFKFGQKHMDYIYACQFNTYNILEGAVRSGKTIDAAIIRQGGKHGTGRNDKTGTARHCV